MKKPPMKKGPAGFINRDQLISLEQASSYCGVSVSRVNHWINKSGLNIMKSENGAKIRVDELIDFLVHHNMPIPETILPLTVRKILFVFGEELITDEIVLKFLMKFFQQLRKEANLIIDYCSYGTMVRMKLLVYKPDLVILDVGAAEECCELCHLVKHSEEFEGIRIAAIVERSRITRDLKDRLCVDALLPRCVEISTLLDSIHDLFDRG